MRAYYNDFDPGAAAWLRELIRAGAITNGHVDDRSILDVRPDDLLGFDRVHFFGGIGGWDYALNLAGWGSVPCWTGSPPCQPFSAAGKRGGRDDARHLGPRFVEMVRAGRPPVLFGEQVASSDAVGRAAKPGKQGAGTEPAWAWWDDLSLRLEAAGYAAWAAIVPAAGVGAPHIRQRLFFAAVDLRFAGGLADDQRQRVRSRGPGCADGATGALQGNGAEWKRFRPDSIASGHGSTDRLADDDSLGRLGRRSGEACDEPGAQQRSDGLRDAGGLADCPRGGRREERSDGRWRDARDCPEGRAAERQQRGREHGQQPEDDGIGELGAAGPWKSYADWFGCCWHDDCRNSDRGFCDCNTRGAPNGWYWDIHDGWVGNPGIAASERNAGKLPAPEAREYGAGFAVDGGLPVGPEHAGSGMGERPGPTNGFWSSADWLLCRDGKWRPAQSSVQRLADGLPGDVVPSGAFVPASYPLAPSHKGARRVMRLRGYGNAIVPQAAAEFIAASREVMIATGIWARLLEAHQ